MGSGWRPGAALLLAVLWVLPLAYAFWPAFHPPQYATRFEPLAPLTLDNFGRAWAVAPFARYIVNTVVLVTTVLAAQLVLCTLAAYAFARYAFPGQRLAFGLVLVQILIMPEILLVENFVTLSRLGLVDTILGIGLPDMASAFGIFLLRQSFKQVPRDLEDAAQVEGAGAVRTLLSVYVPLARPVYLAYGLVSVSYHWNNFLWPLVVASSVETRPVTVGLGIFAAPETGVNCSLRVAAAEPPLESGRSERAADHMGRRGGPPRARAGLRRRHIGADGGRDEEGAVGGGWARGRNGDAEPS